MVTPLKRPLPLTEVEVPKTLFIDHTSPVLRIDWPKIAPGSFLVPLTASNAIFLNVRSYRKVNVLIGQTKASSAALILGKWQPNTFAARYDVPLDQKIHSFDIVGPELALELTAPFTNIAMESVELWLYLTS